MSTFYVNTTLNSDQIIKDIKEFSAIVLKYSESGLLKKSDGWKLHKIGQKYGCNDAYDFVMEYADAFRIFGIEYRGRIYYKDQPILISV